jgi:hypothetical protein
MKTRRNDDRRSRRPRGDRQAGGNEWRPPGPRMVREDWTWEEKRFREIISAHRARGVAGSCGPVPPISVDRTG